MRAVSQLFALLIVVCIIIGLAVAGSGILSSILLRQAPHGSCLVLGDFEWWWEEASNSSFVIYVREIVGNAGIDRVNVTGVWITVGGSSYLFKGIVRKLVLAYSIRSLCC